MWVLHSGLKWCFFFTEVLATPGLQDSDADFNSAVTRVVIIISLISSSLSL